MNWRDRLKSMSFTEDNLNKVIKEDIREYKQMEEAVAECENDIAEADSEEKKKEIAEDKYGLETALHQLNASIDAKILKYVNYVRGGKNTGILQDKEREWKERIANEDEA